jgi:hydrogenase nickel incorporation protein HypB
LDGETCVDKNVVAQLISQAIKKVDLEGIRFLFIENVGNVICPGEFPRGAHERLVVISVTEGPYTVIKHPYIFREADVIALNKIDLAKAMKVSTSRLERDAQRINPHALFIRTNAIRGVGVVRIIQSLGLRSYRS